MPHYGASGIACASAGSVRLPHFLAGGHFIGALRDATIRAFARHGVAQYDNIGSSPTEGLAMTRTQQIGGVPPGLDALAQMAFRHIEAEDRGDIEATLI